MTAHMQIVAAIQSLRPASGFALNGDDYPNGLTWEDESTQPPTLDEINSWFPPPPPSYVPTFVLLGRLTDAEYTAIRQAAAAQLAAGNGQLEKWLDMARTARTGINLNDTVTVTAKAALVAAGLLTPERADMVFAA